MRRFAVLVRCFVLLLSLLASTVAATDTAEAQPSRPDRQQFAEASENRRGRVAGQFVLVNDFVARKVLVYRVPDMRLTGQVDDVGFGLAGPSHSGTVVLPGGRVVGFDDAKSRIVELRIDRRGGVRLARSVPADPGELAAWSAVDPGQRYFAVSATKDDGATALINLVDLDNFANTVVELPHGLDQEVHPWLGGDPATLFADDGGTIHSYRVADLLAGRVGATSQSPSGPVPHGQFLSVRTSTLGVTTAEGLRVAQLTCPGGRRARGPVAENCRDLRLGGSSLIPWAADGLAGGQNFRPRLSNDGRLVIGAIATGPSTSTSPEWANARQDFHAADLTTGQASRVVVANGIAGRIASSSRYAALTVNHPLGDRIYLVDLRRGSETYLEVVSSAPLAPLANGPVAGQSPRGKEVRFATMTPDGRYAFASHGGEGLVSVLDTARGTLRNVRVPVPLTAGGYMTGIDLDFAPADLMGR